MTDTINGIIDERAATHGDPVFTHIRIAQVWSAILDHEVSAHDVALCMAGLKLVRAHNNPNHQDSRDDAQGYIRIADMIVGQPPLQWSCPNPACECEDESCGCHLDPNRCAEVTA